MSDTFFFTVVNFFCATWRSQRHVHRSNWMILERLEPKKSTEVAVGAPGRPCKDVKGEFLAPGFNIFPGGQVTSAKNKSVSHRKYGNDVANSRDLPKRFIPSSLEVIRKVLNLLPGSSLTYKHTKIRDRTPWSGPCGGIGSSPPAPSPRCASGAYFL